MKDIRVTALRFDNTPYRWWQSEVEYESPNQLITLNRVGDLVYEAHSKWEMDNDCRMFYWTDRPYNLVETYDSNGDSKMIYINVASPIQIENDLGSYRDYDLDVVKKRGCSIKVLDEDEFLDAMNEFNYSEAFVKDCRESLECAISLAERWKWNNDIKNLRELG